MKHNINNLGHLLSMNSSPEDQQNILPNQDKNKESEIELKEGGQEEQEDLQRLCEIKGCSETATARCVQTYPCKKESEGCQKLICKRHTSRTKLCLCPGMKSKSVCSDEKCEETAKDSSGRTFFFLPGIAFIALMWLIWYPVTLLVLPSKMNEAEERRIYADLLREANVNLAAKKTKLALEEPPKEFEPTWLDVNNEMARLAKENLAQTSKL